MFRRVEVEGHSLYKEYERPGRLKTELTDVCVKVKGLVGFRILTIWLGELLASLGATESADVYPTRFISSDDCSVVRNNARGIATFDVTAAQDETDSVCSTDDVCTQATPLTAKQRVVLRSVDCLRAAGRDCEELPHSQSLEEVLKTEPSDSESINPDTGVEKMEYIDMIAQNSDSEVLEKRIKYNEHRVTETINNGQCDNDGDNSVDTFHNSEDNSDVDDIMYTVNCNVDGDISDEFITDVPTVLDKCSETVPSIDQEMLARRRRAGSKKSKPIRTKCSVCFKDILTRCLLRHMLTVHSKSEMKRKQFVCNECGKCFVEQRNLDTHKRIHTGGDLHVCDVCGKPFNRLTNLIRHRALHGSEKPYACAQCDKKYAHNDDLKRHVKSNHTPDVFQNNSDNEVNCNVDIDEEVDADVPTVDEKCLEAVSPSIPASIDKEFLARRRRAGSRKSNPLRTQCSVCFKDILTRCLLRHMLTVHSKSEMKRKQFVCNECGKCFVEQRNLVIHKRIHTVEDLHVCDVCGKPFNRLTNLIRHRALHGSEKPYACAQCDKKYALNDDLKRHVKRSNHSPDVFQNNSDNEVDCNDDIDEEVDGDVSTVDEKCLEAVSPSIPASIDDEMKSRSRSSSQCKTQMKRSHCNICFQSVLRQSLRRHMMTAHSNVKGAYAKMKRKSFICTECGARFTRRSTLRVHEETHTRTCERPHACNQCDKAFYKLPSLIRHKSLQHDGEKPYACFQCDKKYAVNGDLTRHVKSSHAVKCSFICQLCGLKNISSHVLKVHEAQCSVERRHVCDQCGKAFKLGKILRRHMSVHSSEKPFACTQCDQKYVLSIELRTHMKRRHTFEKC